jgi:hypothetical protein
VSQTIMNQSGNLQSPLSDWLVFENGYSRLCR